MATDGDEPVGCSLYISPPETLPTRVIPRQTLESLLTRLKPVGTWDISETSCGLIATFSHDVDAETLLSQKLAAELGGPVQVARFSAKDTRYRQAVLLRDVPWAIPIQDVTTALVKQGFLVGSVTRSRQNIRVEVLDARQYETILHQGLDFFGAARFSAVPERWWRGVEQNNANPTGEGYLPESVLQCYRCQGFWHVASHCRHLVRCVRCGEAHSVDFCPRPRNDPVCCHCGGPHHAAYRHCPVRLHLQNATPVSITFSTGSTQQNKFTWSSNR